MTTITELAGTMQALLTTTANELAQKTGFVERQRKVSGAGFAQALVFGFMANPSASRNELNQAACATGMKLSTPGLDKRFNGKAAYFLDSLLAEAVGQTVTCSSPMRSLLSRFSGVYIGDSSSVKLPGALASVFPGSNGPADAAVKLAVEWDLQGGDMGLWWSAATVHDGRTGIMAHRLPVGALHLRDLGFFNLKVFAEDEAQGVYYFSRYKIGTLVFTPEGQPLEPGAWLKHRTGLVEQNVGLGAQQLPCRLIAVPVPPDRIGQRRRRLREIARKRSQPTSARTLALVKWTVYVTNIPARLLSAAEAVILGGTRWQVECLFDVWKNEGKLDETRSEAPCRVWCESSAKLLALLVEHWMVVAGCWQWLNRSYHQAQQVLRKGAFMLLADFQVLERLVQGLSWLANVMVHTCRRSKRRAHPLTFQGWLQHSLA